MFEIIVFCMVALGLYSAWKEKFAHAIVCIALALVFIEAHQVLPIALPTVIQESGDIPPTP